MKRIILSLFQLSILGILFFYAADNLVASDTIKKMAGSEQGVSPDESMNIEFVAAEKALGKGDYRDFFSHADNMRFVAKYTNAKLPKELPSLELFAHHMQVNMLIEEADRSYSKGSYNEAVGKLDIAIAIMHALKMDPSEKAKTLAKKIDSGILEPVYILDEIPPPPCIHI